MSTITYHHTNDHKSLACCRIDLKECLDTHPDLYNKGVIYHYSNTMSIIPNYHTKDHKSLACCRIDLKECLDTHPDLYNKGE